MSNDLADGWLFLGLDKKEAAATLGAVTVDIFDSNVFLVDAADSVGRLLGLRGGGEEGGRGHLQGREGKVLRLHLKCLKERLIKLWKLGNESRFG